MTDEKLMLALAAGDLDKAAVLYERHKVSVMRYFLRNRIEKALAEDFLQQVFYRIIKYRKSFKKEYIFKPWLYKISRNVWMESLKQNKGTKVPLDEAMQIGSETESEGDFNLLHLALKKLPDEYREVLVLSRYQELKYEEIASVLDISVALVKVRVHRGLKILREIYFQME